MKKSILKATSLRVIMIILLVGLLSASIGGFYYIQNEFRKLAADLKLNTQEVVSSNDTASDKTVSLFVSRDNYETLIKQDLDIYKSKISPDLISRYSVGQSDLINPALQSSGIKTQQIIVNFNNPVNYTDLTKFIKAVETNIPKMNIKDINIKSSASIGKVEVEPMTIEVYTK